MSWMQKLYETYENCQIAIGQSTDVKVIPLLPICHTTQKAQIEITIDGNGNFNRAKVLSKDEARTIIPCTESSGGRSGKKPEAHPLCDKLQYVAGDFVPYGGEVTSGYAANPIEPHEQYIEILKKWCDSKYAHPKVKSVLAYVGKRTVIKDLVESQILFVGDDKKLLTEWNASEQSTPEIFKITANSNQSDAFVRWSVEIPNDPQTLVGTDDSLFHSWIDYYLSIKKNCNLCYITGKKIAIADQHPAKIRNDGDKAKLISSNDSSGFTFRGRFLSAEQACSVGFEVTQKAHNALRWLISRQGYNRGQAIVAWSTTGKDIPDPLADPIALLGIENLPSDSSSLASTSQDLALKLRNKIQGYRANLGDTSGIVVMGLDSATPGRMAVTFYRELSGSDFLSRLENWHISCCWLHDYYSYEVIDKATLQKKRVRQKFVGAPAPDDITEAAYGKRVDDKLRKATVARILPCIIDGEKLPRDLMESAVRRAANRVGMDEWEWNKTLTIACALYRKYHEKENWSMALDDNRTERDYLYGRLLALADNLEQWALKEAGEKRQTNAARLMQRFAEHPHTTWRTLYLALEPYKARLGPKASKLERLIAKVTAMFQTDEFISDKKLSGEFLLGYHCQIQALWSKDNKLEVNQADKQDLLENEEE